MPAPQIPLDMVSSSKSWGGIRTRNQWSLPWETVKAVLGPQMFGTEVITSLRIDHITSASRSLLGSHRTYPALPTAPDRGHPLSAHTSHDESIRPPHSAHTVCSSVCDTSFRSPFCGSQAHPPHRPVPRRALNARSHIAVIVC